MFWLTFLLLLQEVQNENNNGSTYSEIFICTIGSSVSIECEACYAAFTQWTYKFINGDNEMEDLGKGFEKVRNRLDEKGEPRYSFSINDANCTYNLLITGIKSDDAGTYTCWDGSVALKTSFVVAIEKTINCSSEPEFPHSKNIIVRQNNPITKFKCYFQYSAEESCIVTPIWTDFTGYRNFSIPLYGIEVNADNNHAWIEFKPGADITNGRRLNLSLSFNCFSNNSRNHPNGRYDFGLLPFIFYVEGTTRRGSINTFSLIVALSTCTILVVVLSILALFLMCLKKYSKCCFDNRAITEAIALGKDALEKPKDGKYTGLREDLRTNICTNYEFMNEGTYEIIAEPEEPVDI